MTAPEMEFSSMPVCGVYLELMQITTKWVGSLTGLSNAGVSSSGLNYHPNSDLCVLAVQMADELLIWTVLLVPHGSSESTSLPGRSLPGRSSASTSLFPLLHYHTCSPAPGEYSSNVADQPSLTALTAVNSSRFLVEPKPGNDRSLRQSKGIFLCADCPMCEV